MTKRYTGKIKNVSIEKEVILTLMDNNDSVYTSTVGCMTNNINLNLKSKF